MSIWSSLFGKKSTSDSKKTGRSPSIGKEPKKGKCYGCGRQVLTTTQFEKACLDAGFTKDPATGNFMMNVRSGVVFLDGNPAYEQAKYNEISEKKGYQCKGCDAVYCFHCLYTEARNHREGGKACPKCGSTFQPFR